MVMDIKQDFIMELRQYDNLLGSKYLIRQFLYYTS